MNNAAHDNNTEQLSRREREKLRHRMEIIEAATRIFAKRGYHMSTLDEVAQEAEFSKGAIYLYFSSKEDLLVSVVKEKIKPFMEIFYQELYLDKPLRDKIRDMYYHMADMAFQERDFFKIVMTHHANEYGTFSEDIANEFIRAHEKFWNDFTVAVTDAIQKGELREHRAQAVTGLVHGACDSMLISRWGCEDEECLKNAIDGFIDILFNGIAKERETA